MARILQCLVCITVMMSSARTQRGYFYHQTYQTAVVYPTENPYERLQGRNLQHDNQPISENLSTRNQDARKHRIETRLPQAIQRVENGTYKILNRLQLNKRGALEDTLTSDRVVFPGPTSKPTYIPQIPDECRKKGYCESVPNYPTEYVKKLVADLGDEVKRFQNDTLEEGGVEIAQRLGGTGTDQEIELCNFIEQLIVPQSAPDMDNKWYTVINLKDKPLQLFRAEVCLTNTGCNGVATFPENYKAGCKQKHVYRMMEALDEHGNHVQKALKLPSCCACVVKVINIF